MYPETKQKIIAGIILFILFSFSVFVISFTLFDLYKKNNSTVMEIDNLKLIVADLQNQINSNENNSIKIEQLQLKILLLQDKLEELDANYNETKKDYKNIIDKLLILIESGHY